ncbi:MAG: hypothetical protein E6I87_09310 [Chloroflexi bacterium]|nr:MAG: hypothetical protein E6I87_09310 [Chloroflexota bacterium]
MAGIPVRTSYTSPWPPFVDPVWRGGFAVLVPEAQIDAAKDILGDVESTARPILPRVVAVIVLVAFVGPLVVSAISWLARR